MRFKPCIDFFRKGNKLLLTWSGKRKFQKIKVTGIKIAYFFKLNLSLPNEEDHSVEDHENAETEYQIWSKIFNFPYLPKRNPKKQEKYREVEEKIKQYVEKNLNKTWENHPLDKYDVFENNELLGGVPDGEEKDENGNSISILEIKTVTDIRSRKKSDRFYYPPINYQLQLALYLYLRGIDVGYICICFLHPDNWQDINTLKLNTKLRKYTDKEQTFSGYIGSYISQIGECPYEYTILEALCNDCIEDNEVLLFRIKINMDKYKNLIDKICNWFIQHKETSPEILQEELRKIIGKNKNW